MTENISGRVLNYLHCTLGDLHEGEQLNLVCLEATCKESGLICPVCREQKHKKHKVLPFKVFLGEISANLNLKQQQHSVDLLLLQIDQVRDKLLANLKEVVQKMVMQIKFLEDQIILSHKNTKQRLIDQNQAQMNFPEIFQQILNNQCKNVETLRNNVKKIIDNISQQQSGKIEVEFKPQKFYDSYTKGCSESSVQLNHLLTQFKNSVQKSTKPIERFVLPLSPYLNTIVYQFSQQTKSQSIQIDQNFATQTVNQNNDNRFILIDPCITESCRINLRIVHLANFIGLGIALKNVLISKNLRFEHQNIGHGSYMISSNGHTWSHSIAKDNMAKQSFLFNTGDIITIEYSLENKNIKFTNKIKPTDSFTLAIDNINNDELYFCVNMCSQGEKIEIIEDE